MKKHFYSPLFAFLSCIALQTVTTSSASAQGCVAVRQMGGVNTMYSSQSTYSLPKGEFQVGASYRYFHSFRHFVGSDEKEFRQVTQGGFDANGNEKGNAVNIYSSALDINASYGLSDRFQLNISVPYVHNERSQVLATKTGGKVIIDGEEKTQTLQGIRYSVYAQGIGDIRLSTNYWILDPKTSHKGNVMVGVGVKLATGSTSRTDDALSLDANKAVVQTNVMMDQAIQPGDGGVGISLELQGFRQLFGGFYGFANGYYLFNPRESNGTYKSAPSKGLEGYNVYASPDQYFARAGVMTSVGKAKNLTLSLAGRLEGIPAYDAFGGQVAYRRPGYVVAIESGISYSKGKHSISLFVPYNFIKNRIQSAADIASQDLQNSTIEDPAKKVHVQGDAAFADYSISVNYSLRLGKLW
jgi:hypothetical protein